MRTLPHLLLLKMPKIRIRCSRSAVNDQNIIRSNLSHLVWFALHCWNEWYRSKDPSEDGFKKISKHSEISRSTVSQRGRVRPASKFSPRVDHRTRKEVSPSRSSPDLQAALPQVMSKKMDLPAERGCTGLRCVRRKRLPSKKHKTQLCRGSRPRPALLERFYKQVGFL